jgi:hypothetical protein
MSKVQRRKKKRRWEEGGRKEEEESGLHLNSTLSATKFESKASRHMDGWMVLTKQAFYLLVT